jgi:hypothetical protein
VKKLFVHDAETGHEVRLGDDAGGALFETMTSEYVIWRYQWDGRTETTRKSGLYAYILEAGEEITIAQQPDKDPWYPKIDNQWVLYTDAKEAGIYFAKLRVHNITTGEDFLLTEGVPYNRPNRNYYAISGNWIAWVDGSWAVRIYDLKSRASRTLAVPKPQLLTGDVSISENIVVWWDRFWHGCDLQQNALFTIPTVPPGWENISVKPASPVTVKDDRLYWALSVNDEVYRFTAPIIRNR